MTKDFPTAVHSLQRGEVSSAYFLNGDDFFLQEFFIDQVEKALSQKVRTEKIFLVPEVMDYTQIIAEITSVSLFPEPKLYILQNPVQIKGKSRKELLNYCQAPNPNNCLIIIMDKYDARSKLIKELGRILGRINTSPPFPSKMSDWVRFLLRQHNLTAKQSVIDRLIELSGDSVYHIANEIEKIKIDLGEKTTVSEENVLQHAGWGRSFFPWHFLDAVGNRDFKKACLVGKSLLQQGCDLSLLVSQMTTMFQELFFRYLGDGSSRAVGPRIGWLSDQIKKRLPYYQTLYKKDEIRQAFRYLAEIDMKIKSTSVNPSSLLVPLLCRITANYV